MQGLAATVVLISLSLEGTRSVFFLGEEYHTETWANFFPQSRYAIITATPNNLTS